MRLWRRALARLKDKSSILMASLGKRSTFRNPDIETAVIKATSHDAFFFDRKNVERIYKWLSLSSANLKPLLWAITMRMEKTHSWVVALKGLMLMHVVFSCKTPAVRKIGRLPFDLSSFKDRHSKAGKTWSHNMFVRLYYTFLDQKSAVIYLNMNDQKCGVLKDDDEENNSLMQELLMLQKMQGLLDMLLQIRLLSEAAMVPLILDAMDCVIPEIFDTYSRIRNGVAKVLVRIYSAGKVEAAMTLRIIQKAAIQGEEVSLYFEICRKIGVMHASECPTVEQIPEEDILELEHIINGVSNKSKDGNYVSSRQEEQEIMLMDSQSANEAKAIVVVREPQGSRSKLRTIITHNWETFDEDLIVKTGETSSVALGRVTSIENSFVDDRTPSLVNIHVKKEDLPDLISFL